MRGRAATAVPLLKRPGRGPRLCTALRSLTPPRCSLAWTWPSCLARVGSSLRAVTPTSRISSRRLSTPPPPPRTTPETCLPGTSGRSSLESTSAAPLRSPPAACFCGTCLDSPTRAPPAAASSSVFWRPRTVCFWSRRSTAPPTTKAPSHSSRCRCGESCWTLATSAISPSSPPRLACARRRT